MIEIQNFEEITQIKVSREFGGKPLYWVAAYFIDGMLIDTGCDHTAEELCELMRRYDLKLVINTHYHEDHIGANYLLDSTFKVNIFAHPKTISLMKLPPKLYPYQEVIWGYPKKFESVIPVSGSIKTEKFLFDILETPGHCEGHVVLIEESKGWCFTGDLFVSENPKVIRPEEDIEKLVSSMEKILNSTQRDLTLFTSVGKIVQNGRSALQQCINYFKSLTRQVKELEQKGHSIPTIRDIIFGGESFISQRTDNQFSSENLVRSALRM
jgi:glyoxylase-like metal-dependent hydrolase (beta-lactamase superfamily II)